MPSLQSLRIQYLALETSRYCVYRYSQVERYNREIQAVKVTKEDKIAVDHTFAMIKSYNNLFTAAKGTTKEIFMANIVPTAKAEHAAHGLIATRAN